VAELIRRMNTRDRSLADLCHPELEWRWPDSTPGQSVFRGLAELARGLDTWAESWDELVIEPEEVLEDGNWVLVMMIYRARGLGSGVYLETPIAHLHQFSDGLLRRWWMLGDPGKARRRFLAGDRPA
jgi:ketosteroid isomerase-like protein